MNAIEDHLFRVFGKPRTWKFDEMTGFTGDEFKEWSSRSGLKFDAGSADVIREALCVVPRHLDDHHNVSGFTPTVGSQQSNCNSSQSIGQLRSTLPSKAMRWALYTWRHKKDA